jgi:hypothetical protein
MMQSLSLRVVVALLTFSIGLAVASVWAIISVERDAAPCNSFASFYAAAADEIPTVTLCEIVSDPERYRDRVVRLKATFYHDAGTVSLGEKGNCAKSTHTYAGFAGFPASCAGNQKLLSIHSGYSTWYDGPPVDLVVVGRSGIVNDGNFYQGREGFNILCVEQVTPDGMGIWQRIYYTVGKVVNFIVPA